jgi:hypothetical protein
MSNNFNNSMMMTDNAAECKCEAKCKDEDVLDYYNVTNDAATPAGHFRAIHRFRTEFLPHGQEHVAMTPQYNAEWEAAARRNGFPSFTGTRVTDYDYAADIEAEALLMQQAQQLEQAQAQQAQAQQARQPKPHSCSYDDGKDAEQDASEAAQEQDEASREEDAREARRMYDDDYDDGRGSFEAEFVEVEYYMPRLVILRDPDEVAQESFYNIEMTKIKAVVKKYTDAERYDEIKVGKTKYHHVCKNPYNDGPHSMNLLHGTGLAIDNGRPRESEVVLACEYVIVTSVKDVY